MLSGNKKKVLFTPSPPSLPLASLLNRSHPSAVFHVFIASTFTQIVQLFFLFLPDLYSFLLPSLLKNSILLSAFYFVSSSQFLSVFSSPRHAELFLSVCGFSELRSCGGRSVQSPTSPQRLLLCAAGKLSFYRGIFFFSYVHTHTSMYTHTHALQVQGVMGHSLTACKGEKRCCKSTYIQVNMIKTFFSLSVFFSCFVYLFLAVSF